MISTEVLLVQRSITAKIRLASPSSALYLSGKSSKSPRMTFKAYRSEAISLAVRKPNRRKTGTGGHQPCKLCCSRNPATTAGSAKNRRLTNAPSPRPKRAIEAALASNVRSMSHSWSSSSSRRLISSRPCRPTEEMRCAVRLRIRSLTASSVCCSTRVVVGIIISPSAASHAAPCLAYQRTSIRPWLRRDTGDVP